MPRVDVNGLAVDIPFEVARLSRGGIADFLVSKRGFSPEELGIGESGNPAAGVGVEEAQQIALGALLTGERGASIDPVREERPIATGFGEALAFTPAGASAIGAGAIGAGTAALREDRSAGSVALGGALPAASTVVGRVGGEVAGRTVRGMVNGVMNQVRSLTGRVSETQLPTGIRTTIGKLTGSRSMQQAEASLARNPVTARKFAAIDKHNENVLRQRTLEWIGVPQAESLELGVTQAMSEAIEKMTNGIPENVVVKVPRGLDDAFGILNRVRSEAFALPQGQLSLKGGALRAVLSDLKAGVQSQSATVRRRSLLALDELDKALRKTPGVDAAAFREGSTQFGRVERVTRPGVISTADPEKINPVTLLRRIEKGNKAAVRTQGGISSGDDATDSLIATARDAQRVGSLTPDSGTPTGLAVPIVAADIVSTGGLGTLGAAVGAEAVESPFGLGLVDSLLRSARGASRGAVETFRVGQRTALPVGGQESDNEDDR